MAKEHNRASILQINFLIKLNVPLRTVFAETVTYIQMYMDWNNFVNYVYVLHRNNP